jgi:ABC-type glycerol-3-phosphate transport system substrate-binding protein
MWSGDEEEVFEKLLRRYQNANPGTLLENLGAIRDDTKTIRAIVAGAPPDLATLAEPLYLAPLAAQGALTCLDELFADAGLREQDFVPASLGQCRYEGRLYGIPFLVDLFALMWNRTAFADAGLDPDVPPKTVDEIRTFAVKLNKRTKNGGIERLGMQPVNDMFGLFRAFGGRLYDEKHHKITADHPGNVAAMEWYLDLINAMGGYTAVNAFAGGFGAMQSPSNPFFLGKVALKIDGQWNPYWTHLYAPNVQYGVAPLPQPVDAAEPGPSTWFGGNIFVIPKGSPHLRQAWSFLQWTQTREAQLYFAGTMHGVPNQRALLKEPELRTGSPDKPAYGKFVDCAETPNGGWFPTIPVAGMYFSELQTARDLVLDGQKTPAQALADVRTKVQRELDRYR